MPGTTPATVKTCSEVVDPATLAGLNTALSWKLAGAVTNKYVSVVVGVSVPVVTLPMVTRTVLVALTRAVPTAIPAWLVGLTTETTISVLATPAKVKDFSEVVFALIADGELETALRLRTPLAPAREPCRICGTPELRP